MQGGRIHLRFAQHAGPAQHFGHREGGGVGQGLAYLAFQGLQLGQQVGVDGQLAVLALAGDQVEAQFHLAPGQLGGDGFAQGRLQHPQVVHDAEMDVEEAGIDAAQFQVQGAACHFPGFGGIAGHTVDHGIPCCVGCAGPDGGPGRGFLRLLYSPLAKPDNARSAPEALS